MSQEDHMKPLTVKELIEILKDFPQDDIVFSEGCDCVEAACYVEKAKEGLVEQGVWVCRAYRALI